ncbi:MAG: hypothetical protein OXC91_03295 [Rhodobacteraceae bacterium]|nr:hypothetical protein [Paracoccaceae bacterium]
MRTLRENVVDLHPTNPPQFASEDDAEKWANDPAWCEEVSTEDTTIQAWGQALGMSDRLIELVDAVCKAKDAGVTDDTLALIIAIKLEQDMA